MDFKYIDNIKELINVIEVEEKDNMERATEIIVNAIKSKNAIFSFGASHAGILSEELFYRAGGLVVINPVFARSLMLDTAPVTFTSKMERLVGYGTELVNKTPIKIDTNNENIVFLVLNASTIASIGGNIDIIPKCVPASIYKVLLFIHLLIANLLLL